MGMLVSIVKIWDKYLFTVAIHSLESNLSLKIPSMSLMCISLSGEFFTLMCNQMNYISSIPGHDINKVLNISLAFH